MNDPKVVSNDLTNSFIAMLNDCKTDFEEEIVVASLREYHRFAEITFRIYRKR